VAPETRDDSPVSLEAPLTMKLAATTAIVLSVRACRRGAAAPDRRAVQGHTDNVGGDDANLKLRDSRFGIRDSSTRSA
jgi:hypothetical protein